MTTDRERYDAIYKVLKQVSDDAKEERRRKYKPYMDALREALEPTPSKKKPPVTPAVIHLGPPKR